MPSNVALTGLARDLAKRQEDNQPVRIGLVGCGEMGTDIVSRVAMMDGVEVSAIAELNTAAATNAVALAYQADGHSQMVESSKALDQAMDNHRIGLTDDASLLLDNPRIDLVIDATGVPSVGADIGLKAMQQGKHLVMMNVEADVTIGAYLKREAQSLGVGYSLGAGDEPSSCMELIQFVSAMGHDIVCAGKGKNNPLNFDAIPEDYAAEAAKRNMNPRMLVEFVDGTKTMVEMTAIANATGLLPDKPGMHGPSAGVKELSSVLVPEADGGVLSAPGRLRPSAGPGVAPGVFVIADMRHPRIRERMTDLKLGPGPYFMFHRPYHLTSLEVPLTCARLVLYNQPDMVPLDHPVGEVGAVAKKNLAAGEKLDAIGEYCYRGWAMTASEARQSQAVPCGLLQGGIVTKAINKGDLLTYNNTAPDESSFIVQLRARQDAMLAGSDQ